MILVPLVYLVRVRFRWLQNFWKRFRNPHQFHRAGGHGIPELKFFKNFLHNCVIIATIWEQQTQMFPGLLHIMNSVNANVNKGKYSNTNTGIKV